MNKWLVYLALILSMAAASTTLTDQESAPYRLGIEEFSPAILEQVVGKKNARIGLITNQTGKDQKGNRTLDILLKQGIKITTIFAPEHGINGVIRSGKTVENDVDTKTKLPILSLYSLNKKNNETSYKNSIDAFIFDIQDVGMRHYTYSATLLSILQLSVAQDIPLIVLDRPALLSAVMEGPIASVANSFLASLPIPVRHGLTMGEIARYCNKHVLKKTAKLHIVQMTNYNRTQLISKLIAPLSPNIQTIQACYGYSFLGLLGEIQPFDVGVGTENAFRIVGLPSDILSKKQQTQLISLLKKNNIQTQSIEYQRRKKPYRGAKITITNINNVSAYNLFLDIIRYCKNEKIVLTFSKDFNAALGNSSVQDYFKGTITFQELCEKTNAELQSFYNKATSAFIYKPTPKVQLAESKLLPSKE